MDGVLMRSRLARWEEQALPRLSSWQAKRRCRWPVFTSPRRGVALLIDEYVLLRSKPQGLRPRTPSPRAKSLTSKPHPWFITASSAASGSITPRSTAGSSGSRRYRLSASMRANEQPRAIGTSMTRRAAQSSRTYVRVRGCWMCLYCAIDSVDDTVEFLFSEQFESLAA